jgi:hypothetical protein
MKAIFAIVVCLSIQLLAVVTIAGCAHAPAGGAAPGSPTTQPTTQPTPGQVVDGAVTTVQTYGPVVQAILAAIPTTAPAAVWLGIALLVLSSIKKNFSNSPTTPDQWAADIEAFAADLMPQLTTLMPGKSAAEVQTIVNAAKAVLQSQQGK